MNKTSDATTNYLMLLLGQSQVNDYDIQRGAVLDKNVEAQKSAALAQEHANQDVVHTTNEARKEKRAALAKSIADIK
jgi:transcriptional regulator CtsR